MRGYAISISVCLVSLLLVSLGRPQEAGLIYFVIAIAVPVNARYHKRAAREAEEAWQARRQAERR